MFNRFRDYKILKQSLVVGFIVASAFTGNAFGQDASRAVYRITATNPVVIVGLTSNGVLSWTNQFPGSISGVEILADQDMHAGWKHYTHIISDNTVSSVKLWDQDTPEDCSFIPAGTFTMGSPTDELGRDGDETRHQVTLTRDFYLQQTEVTNQQMADVLNWALGQQKVSVSATRVSNLEGSQQELLDLDAGYCQVSYNGSTLVVNAGKESYPCIEVSWYGAQAYCNYQSDRKGLTRAVDMSDWSMNLDANGYRLPTESEWEYACRSGTSTAFYTGGITQTGSDPIDSSLDLAGWYSGNSTNPFNPLYSGKGTHEAGLKQANAWGLKDMHGNVWEWCADWYGTYPGTVTDPTGPAPGTRRVLRGGSWLYDALNGRSAYRSYASTGDSSFHMGFRPARTPSP